MRRLRVAIFLVLRSLFRGNLWLNITPTFMMSLVFLNLVFTPALLEGVIETANSKLVNTLTGSVTVESSNAGSLMSDQQELVKDIDRVDGVKAATASRTISAQLELGSERGTAEISGIEPKSFAQVYTVPNYMIEGKFLEPHDRDKIVLGAQIAGTGKTKLELYSDSLKKAHAGDVVKVRFANGLTKNYTVKGIYLTDFVQADLKTLISADEFDDIRPDTKDHASAINVKTDQTSGDGYVSYQISKLRHDLRLRSWQERAGFVQSYTNSVEVVNKILRAVALLVAGLTIFIITYVDVVNKRRQIGIQRAIGISSSVILSTYLMRALAYTVLGSSIGLLIFLVVVVPLEKRYPFHFPLGDVYLAVNFGFMLVNGAILLAVSLISSLIPSWRAVRIFIVDAIWGN